MRYSAADPIQQSINRTLLPMLCLVLCFAAAPCVAAGHAFVTTSPDGRFYFRMVPASAGDPARGFCYEVGAGTSDRLLWQTDGWYANKLLVSRDGRYVAVTADGKVTLYSAGPPVVATLVGDETSLLLSESGMLLAKPDGSQDLVRFGPAVARAQQMPPASESGRTAVEVRSSAADFGAEAGIENVTRTPAPTPTTDAGQAVQHRATPGSEVAVSEIPAQPSGVELRASQAVHGGLEGSGLEGSGLDGSGLDGSGLEGSGPAAPASGPADLNVAVHAREQPGRAIVPARSTTPTPSTPSVTAASSSAPLWQCAVRIEARTSLDGRRIVQQGPDEATALDRAMALCEGAVGVGSRRPLGTCIPASCSAL